jgi:hypothetical protein
MPIPSLYRSRGNSRAWSVARAAAYGAGIGAVAAFFKTVGPLREAVSAGTLLQIAGAAFGFALLCAGAAFLRNFIARRLIWTQ